MKSINAVVSSVRPDSVAYVSGVKPGDKILKVNDRIVKDLIAYRYYTSDDFVKIDVERENGEIFSFEVVDASSFKIGIEFSDLVFDGIKSCKNKCIFCFEDQLPENVRPSLRIKDDDYRLSFFQGNFITLTNLDELDIRRICRLKLSPLYISVHSTDDLVRSFMIGRPYSVPIMDMLKKLARKGIHMHLQIVLVPKVNDGENLKKTFSDLMSLYPCVDSVGVVPVGLSDHRKGLYAADPVTVEVACDTIDTVNEYAAKSLKENKTRLFYAADEFYLKAGKPFPKAGDYEEFHQTENGIGISRIFIDEFAKSTKHIPDKIFAPRSVIGVTGQLAYTVLTSAVQRLNQVENLNFELIPITNKFFGKNITVAGLVVGRDIIEQLRDHPHRSESILLIPDVMLKDDRSVFLDDTTPEQVAKMLEMDFKIIDSTASGLISGVLGDETCLNQ